MDTEDVNYSLISAVREGRLEIAKKLINTFGLSYSSAWSEGYVLLRCAVKNGHAAIAKLLLEKGSKVNSKNTASDTPLHYAVINNDMQVVKVILDKGAKINAKNKDGRTPLHNAVEYKKIGVTELLLKHRADINVRDNNGRSVLHVAVDKKCVQMLLDKGAKIDAKDKYGKTPLYNAIQYSRMEAIELLLKHGANVNASDNNGRSPLHVAIEASLEIVEHILDYGASVNYLCTSKRKNRYAPLHIATERGSEEIIMLLLSKGADADIKGKDNITPLHIAARNGYVSIVEDLLNHGASTQSFTMKEKYTPLHFASEQGNEEMVKLFLNRGADVDASTKGNETALHIATKKGHKTVVKLLLQHGAKVDNRDQDGKTVLHLAVERGCSTIVEDVLKYCPDIDDPSNRTSIVIGVFGFGKDYENIVEALLQYGINVKPEYANNSKLLHAAVEKGYLTIVEDLLKYGANVNMLNDSRFTGFTPLHSAAKNKHEEVAKLLISYEADVNAKDKTGRTPIFYSIANEDFKITQLFLTSGANVSDNPDLLNIAVRRACIEIVETLLKHDANVKACDKYGRTALHYTAVSGGEDCFSFFTNEDPDNIVKGQIAKLILNKGANANAKQENGMTPLHLATLNGHQEVVRVLLEYGADVDSKTRKDITPLHLGARNGNQKIIKTLLKFGADVNSRDGNGRTALHIASQEEHTEVVAILLENGSDINITSRNNRTPLDHSFYGPLGNCYDYDDEYYVDFDDNDDYVDDNDYFRDYEDFLNDVLASTDDDDYMDNDDYMDDDYMDDDGYMNNDDYMDDADYVDDDDDDNYDQDNDDIVDDDDVDNDDVDSNDDYVDDEDDNGGSIYTSELSTSEALKQHIVKLKAANLYVSKKNLLSVSYGIEEYEQKCVKEIANMKSKKINNANITFYDILAKGTSSLAIYMRNENVVQVLKSEYCKTKFPIYAGMIDRHFRKGLERKELLEKSHESFHLLFSSFPDLPHECTEKIFSYLSDKDLRICIDVCKPFGITNTNNKN